MEIYKSVAEYDMGAFYGLPVFRIVKDKDIYKLEYLNCDTKEYKVLKADKNFSTLHSLALDFERKMWNYGIFKVYYKERDKKIREFMKKFI